MANVDFFTAFSYKWAQDGAVDATQDNQYKQGWAYIGAVPPTVEQFNKVGQISDEKSNYLFGQMNSVFGAAGEVPSAGDATSLLDSIKTLYDGGRLIATRVFSAAGATTYTPTAGTKSVEVLVVAGGGGGGGSLTSAAGQCSSAAGGGGGGASFKRITSGFAGVTLTVGTAGGGGAPGVQGGAGGASSFGAHCSATGGGGGTQGGVVTIGTVNFGGIGTQGTGSNGDWNARGGQGWYAAVMDAGATSGPGGPSIFGGGGTWSFNAAPSTAATTPGAGGGGATSLASAGQAGGAGAAGIIIVREFA